ncbi:DUF3823 domain-containing protein [Chitinophaga sp. SYP-B3965]|uniref:DUF3823 domain-containing protein n=1 Tax=Chitinophaga sp. SYP-B3965 TaxID=2663120 RepID=UPI0012995F2E|nr:DUF3823 domain-containing protein [Chitinophaga sp. SYP-B3965]MRG44699.1 DUF3823 domain-containing protein [Chitinophaga sp. SYP-B3965]
MKIIIAILSFSLFLCACEKDNYDPPTAQLSGKLVYQGEPINVEFNQVPYNLFQFGFGKTGPVSNTSFTQEGTYSVLLFNGTYKLIIPAGQGPFLWKKTPGGAPDSITVTMNGSQQLDLEVTPYYMIRTPQITAAGNNVNATFKLEKVITDANAKNIEHVNIYLNKTAFVSGNSSYNLVSTRRLGADIVDPNNVALSVVVPTIIPAQNYIFARIGLKIAGVEDMIFSPVVKLTL